MSPRDPLLAANLSVDYRNKTGVLRDISLRIDRREIVGLVGQSGSGQEHSGSRDSWDFLLVKGGGVKGEILFRGKDLLKRSENNLREIRGKEMSIVLQSPLAALNPALSIGSQLTEAWRAHERGNDALGSDVNPGSSDECQPAARQGISAPTPIAIKCWPGAACLHRHGHPSPAGVTSGRRSDERARSNHSIGNPELVRTLEPRDGHGHPLYLARSSLGRSFVLPNLHSS